MRNLADTSGTLTGTVTYDGYGKVLSGTGAGTSERFKFTGREYDAVTGLYDYRARSYDPATGRFISRDPIGFAGGDANLQRYVGNSPTNSTDPSGLAEIFGVNFVAPWDSRASWWPGDTAGAYYQATGGAIYHTGAQLQNRAGQFLEGLNPVPIVSGLWNGPDGGYAQAYAADWEQAKRYLWDPVGTYLEQDKKNYAILDDYVSRLATSPDTQGQLLADGIILLLSRQANKLLAKARSGRGTQAPDSAPAVANAAGGEPITSVGVIRPGADPLPHQMGITPRTNNGTALPAPKRPPLDPASASRPTKPGSPVSEAAAGIDSHAGRPGWPGPQPSGNVAAKNAQAQSLVDDVLNHPSKDVWAGPHSRPEWGGSVTEVYRPDGLGVRFDANGRFIGFITRPPT